MHFANLLSSFIVLLCTAQALPLSKRFYSPSSPVFSVIAHHEGGVFQYNLLKWNGEDLLLNADEKAFFGRVRASQGYVLNLPIDGTLLNGTQEAAGTANVHVDPQTHKLTTTLDANSASHDFAINDSKLSYKNSTEFLACPDLSYQGQYHVYWGNYNQTLCPRNVRGYSVELLVQVDAYTNYTPESNKPFAFNTTSSPGSPVVKQARKRFFFF